MVDYIEIVNRYFNVDITKQTRKKEIRLPRQIYSYCMFKLNEYSYLDIAKSVGLKNHSTIIHSVKTIGNDIKYDLNLREDVLFLVDKLKKLSYFKNMNGFKFIKEVKKEINGKCIVERVFTKQYASITDVKFPYNRIFYFLYR